PKRRALLRCILTPCRWSIMAAGDRDRGGYSRISTLRVAVTGSKLNGQTDPHHRFAAITPFRTVPRRLQTAFAVDLRRVSRGGGALRPTLRRRSPSKVGRAKNGP